MIRRGKKHNYYVVKFKNTGTIKEFRADQIKSGCIRDPYAKRVCGIACTGDIKTKGKYKPLYSVWHDMINRCYNTKNKRYCAYNDVTVCDRWLVFENFYHDAQYIDGYDSIKIANGSVVLDKDIKQRNHKKKIYSSETCLWVPKYINNEIQDAQQSGFVAVSPTGKKYYDYNISRFAREHGLTRKHISSVLHGRTKTTGGWSFYYQEIV